MEGQGDVGGLKSVAFEVTLKEAEGKSPFKPIENKTPITEDAIAEKLELATQRRLSLVSQIQEQAAKEAKHAIETSQKVKQDKENKLKQLEESLAADLIAKEQNRQQLIIDKQQRLRQRLEAHASRAEDLRHVLDGARTQLSDRITAELELAEDRRNKQLGILLERIKEHDARMHEIRRNIEEENSSKEEKFMEKMETSLRNREEQLTQLIERLQEHNIHVENVRKNKATTEPAAEAAE